MDHDGFSMQSRRRRGSGREPAPGRGSDEFLTRVPNYGGSDEQFEREHARLYGKEEKFGPDGKHQQYQRHFPNGSERERLYMQYNASTKGRDSKRASYNAGLTAATNELDLMDDEEQSYYEEHTGGFTPLQHERLDPRARAWRDTSYR